MQWSEGYSFDAEQLAVEVIENVGPGGHFLGEQHTLDHMREFFRSKAMNRLTWEDWEAAGKPEPWVAAQAEADQRFVLTGKRWLVVDGQPQCEACRAFVTSNFKRCIWCGVVVDRRAVSP
jgi:trimethylamine:corrinoid methyltransferase-like protein